MLGLLSKSAIKRLETTSALQIRDGIIQFGVYVNISGKEAKQKQKNRGPLKEVMLYVTSHSGA